MAYTCIFPSTLHGAGAGGAGAWMSEGDQCVTPSECDQCETSVSAVNSWSQGPKWGCAAL